MDLSNNIFLIFLIFFVYILNKYFLVLFNKYDLKILIDDQFNKPQAFHSSRIPMLGGIGLFVSFLLLCLYLHLSKQIIYFEYLSFCSLFFLLGFVDDLKINIRPKFRLLTMISFLLILVIFHEFYVEKTGIAFLNKFLEIDIFALFFVCLCFLFIINGANLIDGFNGLLGIHFLIITIHLFFINYFNENFDLAFILLSFVLITIIFLKFNFPKASLFLGDGGSYFLGAFVSVSIIKTSIANPEVSPFYFCILLFYLFFEVFFSFIRKISVENKSPLFPDKKHLHMLVHKILYKKNKDKLKSNYLVSIIINTAFLILIIPANFMMNSGLFCKYYSLLFFLIYIFTYKMCKVRA